MTRVQRGRRTMLSLAVAAAAVPAVAGAQPIHWIDWTSATQTGSSGTVQGTMMVGGTPVNVTYTGEIFFTQTDPATDYWQPRSTFLGAMLTDASPITSDIIAVQGGTGITNTFTFSQPILNPYLSILSLGQGGVVVSYVFDGPFTIVAGGPSSSWGGGAIVAGAGNTVTGDEGNGTVRFNGSFSTLSFTITGTESWHGFTLGVEGLAPPTTPPTVVPEPSTVLLTASGLLGLGVAARRRRRHES